MNINEASRISAYTHLTLNKHIQDLQTGETSSTSRMFSGLVSPLTDEDREQKLNEVDLKAALKQAIKDFQDEQITGLTDEERERIEAEVRAYLEANPGDYEGAKRLKISLMKKYGYKGDPEEEAGIVGAAGNKATEQTDQELKPARSTLYHRYAAEKAKMDA